MLGVFNKANRGLSGVTEFAILLLGAGRKHRVTFAKRDRREAVRVHFAVGRRGVDVVKGKTVFNVATGGKEKVNSGGDVFFIFTLDRRMSCRKKRKNPQRRRRGDGIGRFPSFRLNTRM